MNAETMDKILTEVKQKLAAPEYNNVNVNPDAVKARALEMARRGYEPTEASLRAIELYLRGYGLWLKGDVGTGKSTFFKLTKPLGVSYSGHFPTIERLKMATVIEMTVDELRGWLNDNRLNEVVIEDVCAETQFNHYGDRIEILPYIIEKRIEESPCRTHATSNVGLEAIRDRHGMRILDRFSEMFAVVDFRGRSRRFTKPNAVIHNVQTEYLLRRQLKKKSEEAKEASKDAPQGVSDAPDGKSPSQEPETP